jgi:hypothetical protein
MEKLARLAVEKIESYKSNEIIMGYVLSEARKQVALDGAARVGSILSEADIELLEGTNSAVRNRVDRYVQTGLFGVFIKSLELEISGK